jgi:hypothetical protein
MLREYKEICKSLFGFSVSRLADVHKSSGDEATVQYTVRDAGAAVVVVVVVVVMVGVVVVEVEVVVVVVVEVVVVEVVVVVAVVGLVVEVLDVICYCCRFVRVFMRMDKTNFW